MERSNQLPLLHRRRCSGLPLIDIEVSWRELGAIAQPGRASSPKADGRHKGGGGSSCTQRPPTHETLPLSSTTTNTNFQPVFTRKYLQHTLILLCLSPSHIIQPQSVILLQLLDLHIT